MKRLNMCSPSVRSTSSEAGRELDSLAERLGQVLDAEAAALFGVQVVQVLLHRLGQLVALLDSFESGLEKRSECQVRVARRVRAAQLCAHRLAVGV